MVFRLHEWPWEPANLHASKLFRHIFFLGLWTEHYLILYFFFFLNSLPYYKSLRRLSLVQSVAPRWIRAEIICLHVDLLAVVVIFIHGNEIIDIHQNSGFVLFLRWRSRVIDNCCKPSFQKDTCWFWLKFPNKWSAITNFKLLRELDRG